MTEPNSRDLAVATTAQDVVDLFAVSPRARTHFDRWRQLPGREHVVEHVMAHTTAVLYRITAAEILEVSKHTDHALGHADRCVAESVGRIVDWRPDFAMTHVHHYALERLGRPYTWQEFRSSATPIHRRGRCCGSRLSSTSSSSSPLESTTGPRTRR